MKTKEEIEKLAESKYPMTFYNGTMTLDDKLFDIKRKVFIDTYTACQEQLSQPKSEVSAKEILSKKLKEYNPTVRQIDTFLLSQREMQVFIQAMQEYASELQKQEPNGLSLEEVQNRNLVIVPIRPNFAGDYRLEYDGKYITLFGKDNGYEVMKFSPEQPTEYEEMVLESCVIEIRNATPIIKEVTNKNIVIDLGTNFTKPTTEQLQSNKGWSDEDMKKAIYKGVHWAGYAKHHKEGEQAFIDAKIEYYLKSLTENKKDGKAS